MLNLNPGDIFAENYRIEKYIGAGGFADVWEATFIPGGNLVALKIYSRLDESGIENSKREYAQQSDLSHSNLIVARYYGYHQGHPFIEMRLCAKGNAAERAGLVDEKELANCMYNIGSALAYVHDNDIVHQDIKPNNFLIDDKDKYNLADLGLSVKLRKTMQKFTVARSSNANINTSAAGTTPPCYRAPELSNRSKIGDEPIKATDIWAFGAALYELATNDLPFGDFGGASQIHNPEPPDLPAKFSPELNSILKKCMAIETWDRPSAEQIAEWGHNYLKNNKYGFEATILEEIIPESPQHTNVEPTIIDNNTTIPITKQSTEKKFNYTWTLVAVVTVSIIAIWNGCGKSGNVESPTTDTAMLAPADSAVKASDTVFPDRSRDTATYAPSSRKQGDIALYNSKEESATSVYENIDVKYRPLDATITISKIMRSPKNLKVVFNIQKTSKMEGKGFRIFGPETPAHCFYIKANGREYNLININPKGEYLYDEHPKMQVYATFEKIPENVNTIDIWEGRDRDSEDSYWNFKGVHLK